MELMEFQLVTSVPHPAVHEKEWEKNVAKYISCLTNKGLTEGVALN